MKKRQKITATAVLALTMYIGSTASPARANFADDWAGQTTSTNAGYFKGGDRGFLTGGSFSARWPMGTDNLMTITPPKIKAGCGGIDGFLGGFSFLDVDKLVQNFQLILSAAPAAAFDLALKTVAPQISDTIKSLKAMVDKLNNIQLDNCKASKALVALPFSFGDPSSQSALEANATADILDFKNSSGFTQDWDKGWKDLQKNATALYNDPFGTSSAAIAAKASLAQDAAGATGSCPVLLTQILNSPGSVLDKLGARRGIPPEYINQLKAYIGDVAVNTDNGFPKAEYQKPCTGVTYDTMLNGTAKTMVDNTYGAQESTYCKNPGSGVVPLQQKISDAMNKLLIAQQTKGSLDNTSANLLQGIPISITSGLTLASEAGIGNLAVTQLSGLAANAMVYQMIGDLLQIYQQTRAEYLRVLPNTAPQGNVNACKVEMFKETIAAMEVLNNAAGEKAPEASRAYAQKAQEMDAIQSVMATFKTFKDKTIRNLASIFSPSVAQRATGG